MAAGNSAGPTAPRDCSVESNIIGISKTKTETEIQSKSLHTKDEQGEKHAGKLPVTVSQLTVNGESYDNASTQHLAYMMHS